MQEYVERLAEFLKAKNITKSEFADSIGIGRPNVTHIFNGRYGLTDKVLSMIFRHYKELNPIWLLSGNGNMLIEPSRDEAVIEDIEENNEVKEENEEKTGVLPFSENILANEEQHVDNDENKDLSEPVVSSAESQNTSVADSPSEISQPKPFERRIQKIVFFYNDKTFEEYFPE